MAPSSPKTPPLFGDKTAEYDKKLMGKMVRASQPAQNSASAIRRKYANKLRHAPVRPRSDKEVTRVQTTRAAAELMASFVHGSDDPFDTDGMAQTSVAPKPLAKRTLIDPTPPMPHATRRPPPLFADPTHPERPRFLTDTGDPTRYRDKPPRAAIGTAIQEHQVELGPAPTYDVTVNYQKRRRGTSRSSDAAGRGGRPKARGSNVPPDCALAETMLPDAGLPPIPSDKTPTPARPASSRLDTLEEITSEAAHKRMLRGAVPRRGPGGRGRLTTGARSSITGESTQTPTATIAQLAKPRGSGAGLSFALLSLTAALAGALWWIGAFELSTAVAIALLPGLAVGGAGLLAATLSLVRIPKAIIVAISSLVSAAILALSTFLAAWTQGWRELPWPDLAASSQWPLEITDLLRQLSGLHGTTLLAWAAGLLFAVTLVSSMRAAR